VLQLSIPSQTLSTESPSNDHNNREQHQCKSVVTRKRWRIWKKSYLHSLLKYSPQTISLSVIPELWTSLYSNKTARFYCHSSPPFKRVKLGTITFNLHIGTEKSYRSCIKTGESSLLGCSPFQSCKRYRYFRGNCRLLLRRQILLTQKTLQLSTICLRLQLIIINLPTFRKYDSKFWCLSTQNHVKTQTRASIEFVPYKPSCFLVCLYFSGFSRPIALYGVYESMHLIKFQGAEPFSRSQ
jgi:hypothetical protein